MAPLPFIKIFAVLFKEIAKPMAARLKNTTAEHPRLRGYAINVGRVWEGFTQRVEVWTRGGRVKELKPISDSHALTVGAEFISQSFLLSSAMGLVLFEWYRSTTAAARAAELKKVEKALRVAAKEARLADIEGRLAALAERMHALEASHSEHSGLLGSLIPGALGYFSSHASPQQHAPRLLDASAGSAVAVSATPAASSSRNRTVASPASTVAVGALPAAAAAADVDDVEAQYLAGVEARLHVMEQHGANAAAAAAAAAAPSSPPSSSSWFGWLFGGWRRGGPSAASATPAPAAALDAVSAASLVNATTTADAQPVAELR